MGLEAWILLAVAFIGGLYKLARDDPSLVLKIDGVTTYMQMAGWFASVPLLLVLPICRNAIAERLRTWEPAPSPDAIRTALSGMESFERGAWWVMIGSFGLAVSVALGAVIAKRRLAEIAREKKVTDTPQGR